MCLFARSLGPSSFTSFCLVFADIELEFAETCIYLCNHQYMCSCFCGLASILAEDIKPRASCTEEVLGYAHISIKGLSSVSVLLRASVFTECCRGTAAELKGSYAVSSHQIIQYVSSWFWVITPCFIRSFSNQVKFYDSSNMFHTFPCYTLFLIPWHNAGPEYQANPS